MQANRKNAHVRRGRRGNTVEAVRQSVELQANEAEQLLNHPAFKRGFDATHDAIIKMICETPSDGSPEFEAAEREMCRSLRTLYSLKMTITKSVQKQKLRLADFKPTDEGAA